MAQQPASVPAASTLKTPFFLASSAVPDFAAAATGSYASSSSSSSDSSAVAESRFDLASPALNSLQPPPRRRYGRPNYAGTNSNPDGSQKYDGEVGFGLTLPVGDTHYWETPGWTFQVGAGRNFNKNVGVMLQFDYDHFGLQGATLANQEYIYNYCTIADSELPVTNPSYCFPAGPNAGNLSGLDGSNHVWSFTFNPTYTLASEGSAGAYLVVGGGFYHKVTNFTAPTVEETYYGPLEAEAIVDHYTSNAFGVSGGFGLTYKFSHFSNERFYMEARYVLLLDSQRTGVTAANVANSSLTATDLYPANSNRTSYIPIKFGIRF